MLCWFQVYSKVIQLSIYVYLFFSKFFSHYRLLQDIEYSSLSYPVGPYCLSILYIVVGICKSQTPNLSFPAPAIRFGNHNFIFYVCESISVF